MDPHFKIDICTYRHSWWYQTPLVPSPWQTQDARSIHLSQHDLQKIIKVKKAADRKLQLGHARLIRNKGHPRGLIVDSGASVTLLKKTKLLRKIENRIKLAVRTATGAETTTRGKRDLVIRGCIQDGTIKKLRGAGTGHFLPELTHSLLSVLQLCSNGCTIVLKPREAYLVTPDGGKVLFERHQGL